MTTTPSRSASLDVPAEHLADLMAEFPLHSEWTNASGDRRTIVGYPRRGDLLLVEACAGQAPVRVRIEDVRREYTRVAPPTPCPITEAVRLRLIGVGDGDPFWLEAHPSTPNPLDRPTITLHPPDSGIDVTAGNYGFYTWGGGA